MSTAAEKLRNFIREEVRKAVKQEMKKALNESYEPQTDYMESFKTPSKRNVQSYEEAPQQRKSSRLKFDSNANPFADMLNETALNFDSSDARSFGGGKASVGFSSPIETTKVGTVNDMLSTARPSSNLDMVSIDAVPDFSALMSKMKERGQI